MIEKKSESVNETAWAYYRIYIHNKREEVLSGQTDSRKKNETTTGSMGNESTTSSRRISINESKINRTYEFIKAISDRTFTPAKPRNLMQNINRKQTQIN